LRAVLDVNVIVSALLSPSGTPAQLLRSWQQGLFELVVSAGLLAELERTLAYPKVRKYVPAEDARAILEWLEASAVMALDPPGEPPVRSPDPGDDYVIALAAANRAVLVSGDSDVLDLATDMPIVSPTRFLQMLPTA
jgi:putative PIN family toxin of toxin-antitoxin system